MGSVPMAEPVDPVPPEVVKRAKSAFVRTEPITAIDILRHAIMQLAAQVKFVASNSHTAYFTEIETECNKIIHRLEVLDAINHAASDDGTGHCAHCHKVVQTTVTHVWPLRD